MEASNLFQLFNDKIFRIPDYQRGYAWEDKQLVELWDDLEEIPEAGGDFKSHYTGTIYLEEEKNPPENEKWVSGVKFYNVVDGQQRLTTISILIYELIKLAEKGYSGESTEDLLKTFVRKTNLTGKSVVYKFSYAPTDKNFNFLLYRIFEDKSSVPDENNVNLYSKNLAYAKQFFFDRLQKQNPNQRELLFKKLANSLSFDVRIIDRDLDVQAVFETMNNRGKPLSTLEKLKNRLIYLTDKLTGSTLEDKRNLREKINQAWGRIYSCLAQNPDSILDEDVFLSAHLSLYRKPKEAVFSENIAEEKVFQMFCNKSDKFDKDEGGIKEEPVAYQKIEDYVLSLSKAAPIWYNIHNSNLLIVKKLLLLNSTKELKVFLLALLFRNIDEISKQVLQNLEKLLFRNQVLWTFDERSTANWGRELYKTEDNIENITKEIDDLNRSTIVNQTLIQSMNRYFSFVNGPKGFHRWGALKYFLFEYEERLKNEFMETNDKVSIDDYDSTTIEHIVPQKFEENWQGVVNDYLKDIEGEKINVAKKVFLNTLGNLTILKDGKNSSLGNRGWHEKQNRFSTGSYNEIEVSKSSNWTKKEILERGLKMLSVLQDKIAGLELNGDERSKILFYEDYIANRFAET